MLRGSMDAPASYKTRCFRTLPFYSHVSVRGKQLKTFLKLSRIFCFSPKCVGGDGYRFATPCRQSVFSFTNLILFRRDSYFDHVKPSVKPVMWNLPRNDPLFDYGLFLDDITCMAEQDITKFEASNAAPGASQRTGWRAQHKYQPYERCEHKGNIQTDQHQPWRQFATGQGRSRGHDGSGLSKSDTYCNGVAEHALVLGPGQSVGADSTHASAAVRSSDTAFQWRFFTEISRT